MTTMVDLEDIIEQAMMSLSEARKSNDVDLFVLNTCDINGTKQKGDLKLKILQEGKYTRVTVPDTWIPWEITKYTTRAVWLKDPVFASLIDKGAITIINNKIAKEILEMDEAQFEQQKLLNREQAYENGFRNTEQSNQELLSSEKDRQKMRDAVDRNNPTKAPTKVKLKMRSSLDDSDNDQQSTNIKLIAIMNNKDLEESTKLNAIINMKNELQLSDYDYIMNRLTPKETRIKDYILRIKK